LEPSVTSAASKAYQLVEEEMSHGCQRIVTF
jgi:hypothetical protein